MLQKNGLPSIVIPMEIFEDENLYIPEYTRTFTETPATEVTNTNTVPHSSEPRHIALQPLPQRQPKETVQARKTNNNTERKRKQTSPLNKHPKQDKKDPPIPVPRRRRHDDTILSDEESSDSESDLVIAMESEDHLLPSQEGAVARPLLPERGRLGRLGSTGNWSADSQDYRLAPSCSQDSLPDLEDTSRGRSRNRYRDQVTPIKVNPGKMGLH